VQTIGRHLGMQHETVDKVVSTVDARLRTNSEQRDAEPA